MNIRTNRKLKWVALMGIALGLLQFQQAAAAPAGANPHVEFAVESDMKQVAPGSTFHVGIVFTMDPHWHIYWENSGDSGIPTLVDWTVPPGVTVGPLQWETPRHYVTGGMIVSYGFEGKVVLWSEMQVPAGFSGDKLTLAAKTNWLVCEEICIPGGGEIEVEIPVGTTSEPSTNAVNLARAIKERAPVRRASDLKDLAVELLPVSTDFTYGAVRLSFDKVALAAQLPESTFRAANKADIVYFYARPGFSALTERAIAAAGGSEVTIPFADPLPAEPGTLTGLLTLPGVGADGKQVAAIDLSIDVSALVAASMKSAAATTPATSSAATTATSPEAKAAAAKTSGKAAAAAPAPKDARATGFKLAALQVDDAAVGGVANKPLLVLLLMAFVGGLILNVMPCVLPVISLKIFSMVRQSGESPRRMLALGFSYTAGVVLSFWVLAGAVILLNYLGGEVGWANQFREPYFLYAMLVVLTVFAMSLFGLFEVAVPGAAERGARACEGEGLPGAFFGGTLSTVLATPCMAPILAPVIGYAFVLTPLHSMALFTVIALGLASPFLLLSFNPKWTRFLPKPGNWMVTFKQLMGFAMLGAAAFPIYVLLGLSTDSAVEPQWMGLVLLGAMLLAGLGAFLWGHFAGLTVARPRRLTVKASVVLLFLAYHLGVVHATLMQARTPVAKTAGPATAQVAASTPAEIAWVPFSVEELERRIDAGENVFVDFTATWCITCKLNESTVIDTPAVREVFASGAITPMKADWTRQDPEITRVLDKFGRPGVPMYLLLKAHTGEARVLPELLRQETLLEAFAQVAGS